MPLDLMLTDELYAGARTSFHMEKRYLHRDGHLVWINLTVALVHDAQGRPLHTVAHIEDISGRKLLEQELRASEDADAADGRLGEPDVLAARHAAQPLSVYQSGRGVGAGVLGAEDLLNDSRCWRRNIHPQDLARVEALLSTAPQTGQYDMQLRLLHPDGSLHWIHARAYPIWDDAGTLYRCAGVIEDITARKKAEAELIESRQQLRVLSAKVLAAQEIERRRIAHELHDELGQALTAIKINLQTDARMAPHSDGGLLAENLRIVESALQQVRGLALALRPSMLDDLGLLPALRWLTEQTASRNAHAGAPAGARTAGTAGAGSGDSRFSHRAGGPDQRGPPCPGVAMSTWHASTCRNRTRCGSRMRDDGVGFDVDAMRQHASQGNSMGVLGMQERAIAGRSRVGDRFHSRRRLHGHTALSGRLRPAPPTAIEPTPACMTDMAPVRPSIASRRTG